MVSEGGRLILAVPVGGDLLRFRARERERERERELCQSAGTRDVLSSPVPADIHVPASYMYYP